MNLLRLFGGAGSWSLHGVERPWPDDREPLLEFIRRNLDSAGQFAGGDLPDEEWSATLPGVRFMPGLFDRTVRSHDTWEDAEQHLGRVFDALFRLASQANARNFRRLVDAVLEERLSDVLEVIRGELEESRAFPRERTGELGRVLISESPDRDLVKFGLLLVEQSPLADEDVSLVTDTGRHGEFTALAARCLRKQARDWEGRVWELGRATTGWGRVACVVELAGTTREDICDWLLREGWDTGNTYGDDAAIVCARRGDLAGALETAGDEFFETAHGLIEALIHAEVGTRSEGLDVYEGGPRTVERYVSLLQRQPASFRQFEGASRIERYVSTEYREWEQLEPRGWTPELRAVIAARCQAVLGGAPWEAMVREALSRPVYTEHSEALAVAHRLGLDLWDYWHKRVLAEGGTDNIWRLLTKSSEDRTVLAIALAIERFDLAALGSGPRDEMGLGPAWKEHRELDFFVQALGSFPGRGWELLRASLSCPVTGNRFRAGRALGRWPRESWPADAEEILRAAVAREPDDGLRASFSRLLRGERFDETDQTMPWDEED